MEIEAAYCSISGRVERGLDGYLELTSGFPGETARTLRSRARRANGRWQPLYWLLDAGPCGALSRPPGPAILARSGRPFPAGGCPTHTYFVGEEHSRGCQDQTEAPGEDPGTVLPGCRRRRAHQARRACHRRDRQVPPEA